MINIYIFSLVKNKLLKIKRVLVVLNIYNEVKKSIIILIIYCLSVR